MLRESSCEDRTLPDAPPIPDSLSMRSVADHADSEHVAEESKAADSSGRRVISSSSIRGCKSSLNPWLDDEVILQRDDTVGFPAVLGPFGVVPARVPGLKVSTNNPHIYLPPPASNLSRLKR